MEEFQTLGAGPALNQEIIFVILQFLGEEKFKESVHKLEQESGLFFDVKYFEDQVEAGAWEEVERYLSGFLKVNDNDGLRTIFFEIGKQKYLEALDRHNSQHELCKNSNPSPDMKRRCTNYTCLSNKGNDVPARNTTIA